MLFEQTLAAATLAAAVPAVASAQSGGPIGDDVTAYFVGNSLTRGLTLGDNYSPAAGGDRLGQLFADAGGDLDYGGQAIGGGRLFAHLDKQGGRGGSSSMGSGSLDGQFNTFNNSPTNYGEYDDALSNFGFDALILQPFQFEVDVTPPTPSDGDFVIGDRQATNAFIDYALGDGPRDDLPGRFFPAEFDDDGVNDGRFDLNNRNLRPTPATDRFYIYETQGSLDGLNARTNNGTYADFYDSPDDPNLPENQQQGTRGYTEALVNAVNSDNATNDALDDPVRVIPVGAVLAELDRQIRDDALPGIEDYFDRNATYYREGRDRDDDGSVLDDFPFEGFRRDQGVKNFYTDLIHFNPRSHNDEDAGSIGAYVAGLTVYTTLTGNDPAGVFPTFGGMAVYEKLDPTADAALIAALQGTVFDVVRNDPLSGVPVPEPTATLGLIGVGLLALRRRRTA